MMTIQKSTCKLDSHALEPNRTNSQNEFRILLATLKIKKEIFSYEMSSIFTIHISEHLITQLHIFELTEITFKR